MREILFRARTVSESEYMDDGEWIEGFYTCFNGEEHRIYTGYSETDCGDHYPDWFNVLPETVGQFTGLTDKNGKKIFEGDIVNVNTKPDSLEHGYKSNRLVIRFDEYHRFVASGRLEYPLCNHYEWEIIGNIYDNPITEVNDDER